MVFINFKLVVFLSLNKESFIILFILDTKSTINTQVTFDSDEFNSYEIEKEMDITFCLKEFKICLTYGFWFDLSLDIYFKKKGR